MNGRNSRIQDDVSDWPLPNKILGCATDIRTAGRVASGDSRIKKVGGATAGPRKNVGGPT